ncbi:MAG: DNA polymerase III subunit alpha [bacterium]
MTKFAYLHAHSEYSLRDGCMSIKQYLDRLEKLKVDAAALTDTHNLFGAFKFYNRCQARGIKPIVGADLRLREQDYNSVRGSGTLRMRVLVENRKGYSNLSRLLSESYRRRAERGLWISLERLAENKEGLFLLGPHLPGYERQITGERKYFVNKVKHCSKLFGERFFVEVPLDGSVNKSGEKLLAAAEVTNQPALYTNPAYFPLSDDYSRLPLRRAVQTNTALADLEEMPVHRKNQWVCSREELVERAGDNLEPLEQAGELASRCFFEFETHQLRLPAYPEAEDSEQMLEEKCEKRLQETELAAGDNQARQRLDRELEVINKMGFADYFLIVADVTGWARKSGIAVGPGRGSAAGSLVAFLLGITEIDPFQFDLIFERFLNEQRREMPDIDLDFPDHRRQEVIDYISRRFGEKSVAHIITFGQLKARNSLRSIGRVRGEEYEEIDRFLSLLPDKTSDTLQQLRQRNEQLETVLENNSQKAKWFEQAIELEGFVRNPSLHAAGILIAEGELEREIPLYFPDEEDPPAASQFDMYDVEDLGYLKLDILGLSTLTLIEKTLAEIPAENRPDVDNLPDEDSETARMLVEDSLEGVFQFETSGSRELVRKMAPKSRRDLMDCIALYRPGPLQSGMVETYLKRRRGEAEVEYPHPDLEEILEDTYGLIIYQEQVMAVARKFGGFSWSRADRLRRAMSKKKEDLMVSLREEFIEGALENEYEKSTASQLFEVMENFARYGFNRSHSAAYGEITYRTAYLKAHFKTAFYAALCSVKSSNTDRIARIHKAMQSDGIQVELPDVNESGAEFSITGSPANGRVVYGLEAIKNVGRPLAETIQKQRKENGLYESLEDFLERIPPRYLTARAFKSLAAAGGFDQFDETRGYLVENAGEILKEGANKYEDKQSGQERLFSAESAKDDNRQVNSWTRHQRDRAQKEALGFYVDSHPLDKYRDLSEFTTPGTIEKYQENKQYKSEFAPPQLIAIWIESREGDGEKFVRLSGREDELILPLSVEYDGDLSGAGPVLIGLKEEKEMTVYSARGLPGDMGGVGLSIYLSAHQRLDQVKQVKLALESNPGPSPVCINYKRENKTQRLKLKNSVELDISLARRLKNILGPDHLRLYLPSTAVQTTGEDR